MITLLFLTAVSRAEDLSQESAFQVQAKVNFVAHDREFKMYGLGLRYLYKPLEFSGFGLEPNLEFLMRPASKSFEKLALYNLGLDGSFTILGHSPLLGAFASRAEQKISPSIYDPDWGIRAGYRYFWKLHLFGFVWEWTQLRNREENIKHSSRTWSLLYAYTF